MNKLEMNENLWKKISAELDMMNINLSTKMHILNSEIFCFDQMTLEPMSIWFGKIKKEIQVIEKQMSVTFNMFEKNKHEKRNFDDDDDDDLYSTENDDDINSINSQTAEE